MTTCVILADDANHAAASWLAAMGHAVCKAGDVTRAQVAAARKVIVVWSRSARGSPALRAAAQQAKARGKLVCVRLDAALPPVELGGLRAVRLPPGRAQSAAWRRLLRTPSRSSAKHSSASVVQAPLSTPRATRRAALAPAGASRPQGARLLASVAALALVVLAIGAEAFARDANLAARVTAFASDASTRASQVVAEMAN